MNNTDKSEQLEKKICEIFDVFPEELEFGLQSSITKRKMDKLVTVITQQCNKSYTKGHIDGGMFELGNFINDAMYTGRKTVDVSRLLKAYEELSDINQAKETEGDNTSE